MTCSCKKWKGGTRKVGPVEQREPHGNRARGIVNVSNLEQKVKPYKGAFSPMAHICRGDRQR